MGPELGDGAVPPDHLSKAALVKAVGPIIRAFRYLRGAIRSPIVKTIILVPLPLPSDGYTIMAGWIIGSLAAKDRYSTELSLSHASAVALSCSSWINVAPVAQICVAAVD